jgi:hypothetical protein
MTIELMVGGSVRALPHQRAEAKIRCDEFNRVTGLAVPAVFGISQYPAEGADATGGLVMHPGQRLRLG